MKKWFFAMATISIASSGCASERLRITVTDSEGLPISNATVDVSFTAGHVVFGLIIIREKQALMVRPLSNSMVLVPMSIGQSMPMAIILAIFTRKCSI